MARAAAAEARAVEAPVVAVSARATEEVGLVAALAVVAAVVVREEVVKAAATVVVVAAATAVAAADRLVATEVEAMAALLVEVAAGKVAAGWEVARQVAGNSAGVVASSAVTVRVVVEKAEERAGWVVLWAGLVVW